jgi:hypothetical protein
MKRYAWMVVLIAAMGANASDNPFELNQNFQEIDKDQNLLLKELKRASAALEAEQEAQEDAEIDAEEEEARTTEQKPSSTVTPTAPKVEKVVHTPSEKQTVVAKERISEEAQIKPLNKAAPVEVVQVEKIKAEQAKIDAARDAQKKQRAQEEAKRQAAAEKAKKEKAALAKLKTERAAAKKAELQRLKAEKARLEAEKAKAAKAAKVKTADNKTPESLDVNITKEQEEAARRAEEELRKAIQEVDQED